MQWRRGLRGKGGKGIHQRVNVPPPGCTREGNSVPGCAVRFRGLAGGGGGPEGGESTACDPHCEDLQR